MRKDAEFLLDLGCKIEEPKAKEGCLALWLGYVLPLVFVLAIMAYLSSQPKLPSPGFDISFLHVIEYLILSYAFFRLLNYIKAPAPYLMAILFTILVGAVDEVYQGFIPGRTKSIIDFLYDISGALLVLVFKRFVNKNPK